MRFLMSALIAEGPSDDRFLPFLLRRMVEDVCASEFRDDVDVNRVDVIRGGSRPSTVPEILALVEEYAATYHLVFVHRDQDGSTERVNRDWFDPLRAGWNRQWSEALVPVIPVRKTEAWVLADGAALRSVLGIRGSDKELGLPVRPRDAEQIREPKDPIRRLVKRVGRPIDDFYEELAESVDLEALSSMPSFRAVREQTVTALGGLGYRR
ncbi:MAG TPA: DUF4276 family protein [Actinoplanes sp.]|nr:DUF4276 family protein [Actinoplanes sp.]